MASETVDGEVSQEEDVRYKEAAENPDDVPPGTYSEEIGDGEGYRVVVMPEKRTRVDNPREAVGQRRIDDDWLRGGGGSGE